MRSSKGGFADRLDGFEQFGFADRLGQVAVGSGLGREVSGGFQVDGREHDNGDVLALCLEPFADLESTFSGQDQVQQHQVGLVHGEG